MKKRRPKKFSVEKAVKANARTVVGQPKPSRVLTTTPKTGREAKHKQNLETLLETESE
jgi:hypothetical protein